MTDKQDRSIIHSDDLAESRRRQVAGGFATAEDEYIWIEETRRYLISKSQADRGSIPQGAIHVEMVASTMVGTAGTCAACKHVTIEPKGYCPYCNA
jgi:hypothetical protein